MGLFWGIGFPVMLLIIFGAIPAFRKPITAADPQVSVLDAYVPILVASSRDDRSQRDPPVLAGYREKGVLRRMATTRSGPSA